jgi:hypothetical protein
MSEGHEVLCAAKGCENPLPAGSGRGRPAIYCSPGCRPTALKHHRRLVEVEVAHEPTQEGDRPSGRVWSVTIRRGAHGVVIATELGRPSAESLAAQVRALLNNRPKGEEKASSKM